MLENDLQHLSLLQRAELNILKQFIAICSENNLKYLLVGGSLLGAVRHKGFIPWDDDIDVAMPRGDYEKFLEIAQSKLPENIYLSTYYNNPQHVWLDSMLIDKSTKFILNNSEEKKEVGAWIDILVIDGAPPKGIKRKMFALHYLYLRMMYQFANFSKVVNLNRKRPFYENILIKFAEISRIEKVLNSRKIGYKFDKLVKKYDYQTSDEVAAFGGMAKMNEIVPKYYYGEGRNYKYEDIIVKGCSEYDSYLKHFYGDYMQPPPMDERNRHNVTECL